MHALDPKLPELPMPQGRADAPARRQAVRACFAALIEALGAAEAADADTAQRAGSLWLDHLLAGQGRDPHAAVGRGIASAERTPVLVSGLGFHLVCPHHLTVATGTAALGYVPAGRVVGFGHLSELVQVCTARMALQEDATATIAQTLQHALGAHAVAVRLQAHHLCHSVLYPRAQAAQAVTWALEGDAAAATHLQGLLTTTDAAKAAPTA
jgi:GTP cyclohydrolase I